ncbi:MAG: universal stress protein [Anaerolineae bacterium]|nr:universal stress protein [Anaerolineae bacterium]
MDPIQSALANQSPLSSALSEFKQARRQAVLEMITNRLRGRSVELLSYQEIADKLKVQGRSDRGIQTIPVAAIVGSVGRYNDFTRSFLPRHDWDAQRWAKVKTAGHVADLAPIEVYKVGEAYFVLDGNHRVSIARRFRVEFMQAAVTEVYTRVPIAPDIQPDELIIKAEYATFLTWTQLDRLRPFANLQVTIPGQYEKIENHIEVHRFFIEMEQGIELSDSEAVMRWYDEAYLPLIKAIREQDVLHEFPGRTETDLYMWLATHLAQLRNLLGWQIRPGTAVSQFSTQFKQKNPMSRAYQRVLNVVVPQGWQGRSLNDWTQERLLDRYSQHLFTEILVPTADETDEALEQAIVIAQRENGRIVGLFIEEDDLDAGARETRFYERCAAAQVKATWVHEAGTLTNILKQHAKLVDLVVLTAGQINDELLAHTVRPILVVTDKVSSLNKALLISEKVNDTSLFAAAYLAETWKTELLALADGQENAMSAYLDFHEVVATFMPSSEPWRTAVEQQCDLIICGRNGRSLELFKQQNSNPVLIC